MLFSIGWYSLIKSIIVCLVLSRKVCSEIVQYCSFCWVFLAKSTISVDLSWHDLCDLYQVVYRAPIDSLDNLILWLVHLSMVGHSFLIDWVFVSFLADVESNWLFQDAFRLKGYHLSVFLAALWVTIFALDLVMILDFFILKDFEAPLLLLETNWRLPDELNREVYHL